MNFRKAQALIFLATSLLLASPAEAGIFTLPHFVMPGSFSVGVEPEIVFTTPASIGVNLRYTHGLSELTNVTGIFGTGADPKGVRLGGNMVFDFFPDLEGQPGIGIAVQGLYSRLSSEGHFELSGIPYIHKSVKNGTSEFEPFLGIPIGMDFSAGRYRATSMVNFGCMFKGTEHLRYVMEFGMAVNNTNSSASGGIAYYY